MPKRKAGEGVLALDLGTSSVRAVVYDTRGRMLEPTLCDLPYKVQTQHPGEVSSDPDALIRLIAQSIDEAIKAARKQKLTIIAAGASCYWHSLMGVDRKGRPTTELFTWADTRSAPESARLRAESNEREYHARTGGFFHASFWPAKLRWLRSTRAAAVSRTARWISLGEYLYQELFGDSRVSLSIASGTGLIDVNRCEWDPTALRLAGIDPSRLSALADWTQPSHGLRPRFARRWPELRQIPWYLPLGDGGLANVGAGAVSPQWVCATIGTSSALRVILTQQRIDIPWGAFAYRLDRERFVIGGALSEGGNVVRWFTDSLGFRHRKQLEGEAEKIAPDGHGLTVLPFWAGERSPNWRANARAVIEGLSLSTRPVDLMRAAMEAIAYQLATVAEGIERVVPRPQAVIGTGGQLVHSPLWAQMLADVLDLPVIISPEPEASSRGAALMTLHALGRLPRLWSLSPSPGRRYRSRVKIHAIYARGRARQRQLYELIFPPASRGETRSSVAEESGSRTTGPRSPGARR